MGRVSRKVYKPGRDEDGVYLHVYNHCVEGAQKDYPLGDVEKEKFFRHLKRTLTIYSIECLSAVVMSNHFHLILYVPKNTFTVSEMARRIKLFRKDKVLIDETDHYCQRRLEMSNDLSSFMKELQQGFTCWFNRTRSFKRRGTLWEQRFKCSKLADSQALNTCLQYVELNPVRADLVKDPADYRFSTYGEWLQSGKHPFEYSFKKHLLKSLLPYLGSKDLEGIKEYFVERFEDVISSSFEEVEVKLIKGKRKVPKKSTLLRRSRFWIDGMVLGGRAVLKEQAVEIFGQHRGQKKQLGRVFDDDRTEIMSMRQLIVDV